MHLKSGYSQGRKIGTQEWHEWKMPRHELEINQSLGQFTTTPTGITCGDAPYDPGGLGLIFQELERQGEFQMPRPRVLMYHCAGFWPDGIGGDLC